MGEPLPPLMNIPGRGENLAALERGPNLIVHVTLPTLTTEGQVIKQALRLDLRIGPKPSGNYQIPTWAAGAKAVGGAVVANGIAEYTVPAAEWTGKQVLIAVKVIGANGRDAGWSVPAELAVVAPLEQPRNLACAAVPNGVHLAWVGQGSAFNVLRRGSEEKAYSQIGTAGADEYVDKAVPWGKPLSYIVYSAAKAGAAEAQSDLSPPCDITPIDTFPPASPVGLNAVPSANSVELVWDRSAEPNLAGYRVYRATGVGTFERLGDTQSPAYSDQKTAAGQTYRYRVTAVKSNQAESQPSEAVQVTLP